MIRTLIVDDSPLVRDGLHLLLAGEKDIEIVGDAADGFEAVDAIQRLTPDLTFLDVQMPGLDGFQVLERCAGVPIGAVIFVTAYDDYALRAFQANALGYVLKPIAPRMLQAPLQRARQLLASPSSSIRDESTDRRPLDRLVVKEHGRFVLIRPDEVDWIASAGDYVHLHTPERTFLVRTTISELDDSLDARRFVRIHRSTMVNVDRIQEIRALPQGDYTVRLLDGTSLRMSRGFRRRLLP
jgi:two-component system, LytTR family, response regulator